MSFPVLPSTIAFAGVRPEHFRRFSDLHGVGHVNRVICLGQMLGAAVEADHGTPGWFAPLAAPLWAAAFLHDLARRHDGDCTMHGRWAVDRNLPALRDYFLQNGVREEDLPMVATAVEYHSLPENPPRSHPHWTLTALLKDADALDRCRLGPEEHTDPKFLRFPATIRLVSAAERLYFATLSDPALADDVPALWLQLCEAADC